ncbi:MAG TPA: TolC family protein [Candidatus Angelobacter sp.]|nr:TolC family protein [Candidatus Angelobacter sp.]
MLVAAGSVASLAAQAAGPVLPPLPSAEPYINRNTNPFDGSIPQGEATTETIELTVPDALERGLKYNLGLFLSNQTTAEARADRMMALSKILPNINGTFAEQLYRLNLKSLGISSPLIPSSVGPFSLTATQATGSWDLLNTSSIDKYRAATQTLKAAAFSYSDARDTVILAVGANYLLVIAQESRVEATQAELTTAEALYQLASDQEAAGLAPNIDTLRARVQLQAQQEALIQAENDLEKQRIALARIIGLPVQQKYKLVNRVPYSPLPEMISKGAFELALTTRPDYKAAQAQLRAAELRKSAASKQYFPSLTASGAYGVLGYHADDMAPNYSAAATLNIPIYQGGRIQADVAEANAQLQKAQAQTANLRGRIEQEVQDALLDLRAAARQVEVARTGLDLAQQALAQSQDRFAAGVTNNVEVIQSQQQLAAANDQYIGGLFAHNIAKVLLARSIGNAEQMVKQYLSGNQAIPPAVLAPGAQPPPLPSNPPTTPNPPDHK